MNKYCLVTVTGLIRQLAFEAPDDGIERHSLIADAIFESGLVGRDSAPEYKISALARPTDKQLAVRPDFSREGCKAWIISGPA